MTENRKIGGISYVLTRKNVKNINLRVYPDGRVMVSAHPGVDIAVIEKFLLSKAGDILAQFEKSCYVNQKIEYKTGEFFHFFGQKYTLNVINCTKSYLKFEGESLELYTNTPEDFSKKERVFKNFKKELCAEFFAPIIVQTHKKMEPFGIEMPEIRLRDMKSKWGSCMPQRKIITLNTRLIEHPEKCIEYVIIHEFCHFFHANHSKDFYETMSKFMPNWKIYRELLNKSL